MLQEDIIRLIGKKADTLILEVERGAIKKYADAVGENDPLYWDEDYARNTEWGAIVAPPGFFGWPVRWTGVMPIFSALREEAIDVISKAGYPRVLDGGIEYEFYIPVFAGDILIAESAIKDIQEKESKSGKMLLTILETTYRNTRGSLVCKERKTTIQR